MGCPWNPKHAISLHGLAVLSLLNSATPVGNNITSQGSFDCCGASGRSKSVYLAAAVVASFFVPLAGQGMLRQSVVL
jgi:hypothetical protein